MIVQVRGWDSHPIIVIVMVVVGMSDGVDVQCDVVVQQGAGIPIHINHSTTNEIALVLYIIILALA